MFWIVQQRCDGWFEGGLGNIRISPSATMDIAGFSSTITSWKKVGVSNITHNLLGWVSAEPESSASDFTFHTESDCNSCSEEYAYCARSPILDLAIF